MGTTILQSPNIQSQERQEKYQPQIDSLQHSLILQQNQTAIATEKHLSSSAQQIKNVKAHSHAIAATEAAIKKGTLTSCAIDSHKITLPPSRPKRKCREHYRFIIKTTTN